MGGNLWKPITNQDTHIKWNYHPFPEIILSEERCYQIIYVCIAFVPIRIRFQLLTGIYTTFSDLYPYLSIYLLQYFIVFTTQLCMYYNSITCLYPGITFPIYMILKSIFFYGDDLLFIKLITILFIFNLYFWNISSYIYFNSNFKFQNITFLYL